MQVFLSWSGERSKAVAEALADWLPQVIQAVKPWVSTEIDKGTKWTSQISESLEQSSVGVVCITSDNVDSNWLIFEAGAIAKSKESHACTFLLDISPTDVTPPLSILQATKFERGDFRKLLGTINQALRINNETPLKEDVLDRVFETNWPHIEKRLSEIKHRPHQAAQKRPDREILEEILGLVRIQYTEFQDEDNADIFARTMAIHFRNIMKPIIAINFHDLNECQKALLNISNYITNQRGPILGPNAHELSYVPPFSEDKANRVPKKTTSNNNKIQLMPARLAAAKKRQRK